MLQFFTGKQRGIVLELYIEKRLQNDTYGWLKVMFGYLVESSLSSKILKWLNTSGSQNVHW